jgi:AcrR family transcriptional regulator
MLVRGALVVAGGTGTPPSTEGTPDDGSRGSVLDAAVAYYAAEGFGHPALDNIARAAGLSTDEMLVPFEDEAELRHACDEYVLQALVEWAHEKATLEGMNEVMRSYLADPGAYQAKIGYLGRVVTENTAAAPRFIGVLVDESESIIRAGILDGTMRPFGDPRALAVLLAATVLGMVAMTPHVERALGVFASQQQMLLRLAVPALELYTHGLYTDDSYLTVVRHAMSALQSPQQEGAAARTESPVSPSKYEAD